MSGLMSDLVNAGGSRMTEMQGRAISNMGKF